MSENVQHKISLRVEDVPLYCSINSAALTFSLNKQNQRDKKILQTAVSVCHSQT